MVVPPAFLEQLQLEAGTTVGVAVANGRLIVNPTPRPKYTLKKLLAESDYAHPQTEEEREWVNGSAAGAELL